MNRSLVKVIEANANSRPNTICFFDNFSSINYEQFWQNILKIACKLKVLGILPGDRVIIQTPDNIFLFTCIFAVQMIGGISVPVEWDIFMQDLDNLVKVSASKFILSDNVALKDSYPNGYISTSELIGKLKDTNDMLILDQSMPKGSDIAEILFTTGTTGSRKGVMLTHQNNIALAENIKYGVEMKPDNIELIPVPVTHSYGLRSVYASLLNGSSIVFMNGIGMIGDFFKTIDRYHVTSLALVPSAINIILKYSGDHFARYANQIEYIQSGSAALSEDAKASLRRLLPNSRLYNFYGSTEAGRCCILDYNKEPDKKSCIGRPTVNSHFKIISENGEYLPESKNNIGFLACFGKMTMAGYWNDPEETAKTLKDGVVYTSDLAYIEDGCIYYVGRQSDVINSGGIKIIPTEIEEIALRYNEISECICVPVKDDILGQVPALAVIPKNPDSFAADDFMKFLRNFINGNKMPRQIKQIDNIPRTYNGKIDRKQLIMLVERHNF